MVLCILAGSVAWTVESYTGYFRLTRIERSIQLLKQLGEVQESQVVGSDEQLSKIYRGIKSDLDEFLQRSEAGVEIGPEVSKGLAGAAPWFLFSLAFLQGFRKGDVGSGHGILGAIICGVITGIVGALLPDFKWKWINYWAYPIGSFLLVVVLIQAWQKAKLRRGDQGLRA